MERSVNHFTISGYRFVISMPLRLYRIIAVILLLCFSPLLQAQQANLQPSQIQVNNLTVDQLQQAAEAGDPDAQYALGYMYYYGKNMPRNTTTALNWIKRAAVQGQSQAINAMALLGQNTPVPPQQDVGYQTTQDNFGSVSNTSVNAVSSTRKKTTTTTNSSSPSTATTPPATISESTNTQPATKAPVGHYYTIQLLGTSNKAQIDNYINTYNLQGNAKYVQSKHKGKNWYVLVYGDYKTRAEAQAAIVTLPAPVRAKNPFVKLIENGQSPASSKATTKTKGKASSKKTASKARDEALSF